MHPNFWLHKRVATPQSRQQQQRHSRLHHLCDETLLEAIANQVFVQVSTNEDHLAIPFLIRAPHPIRHARQHCMHTLQAKCLDHTASLQQNTLSDGQQSSKNNQDAALCNAIAQAMPWANILLQANAARVDKHRFSAKPVLLHLFFFEHVAYIWQMQLSLRSSQCMTNCTRHPLLQLHKCLMPM